MAGFFWRHLWMLTTLLLLGFGTQDGDCLRNVSLTVTPPAVQRGQHASLFCQYDMEGAALYSVKFYRGSFEFYRYSPSENPASKIFVFRGIHVDLSVSNESQVVLRHVGFNLSGNFSCEVTVEAPSFSTATAYSQMQVVEFPKGPPVIQTERERYFTGDILRANCTSPPSKPAASLSFLLNNHPVGDPDVRQYPTTDLLQSSALSLTMQLYPSHYVNNQLVLKCTAFVTTLYRNTSEVQLTARPKEPVPERVTSPSTSTSLSARTSLALIVLCCLLTR